MEPTMCSDQNRKLPQAINHGSRSADAAVSAVFTKADGISSLKVKWVKNIFSNNFSLLPTGLSIAECHLWDGGSSMCLPFPNLLSRLFPWWILEINTIWETYMWRVRLGNTLESLETSHIYEWMNNTVVICKGRGCNLHIFCAHHVQSATAHSEKHWWLLEREENDGLIFKRI